MAGRLPLQNPLTWIRRSGARERRALMQPKESGI